MRFPTKELSLTEMELRYTFHYSLITRYLLHIFASKYITIPTCAYTPTKASTTSAKFFLMKFCTTQAVSPVFALFALTLPEIIDVIQFHRGSFTPTVDYYSRLYLRTVPAHRGHILTDSSFWRQTLSPFNRKFSE